MITPNDELDIKGISELRLWLFGGGGISLKFHEFLFRIEPGLSKTSFLPSRIAALSDFKKKSYTPRKVT